MAENSLKSCQIPEICDAAPKGRTITSSGGFTNIINSEVFKLSIYGNVGATSQSRDCTNCGLLGLINVAKINTIVEHPSECII
jgi:hypothetical protein